MVNLPSRLPLSSAPEIVGGGCVGGPNVANFGAWAAVAKVAACLVNFDDGFAVVIVSGNNSANYG